MKYGNALTQKEWLKYWFTLCKTAKTDLAIIGVIEAMKYELLRNMEEKTRSTAEPVSAS